MSAARNVLEQTRHQHSTRAAALEVLAEPGLSVRAAARRWGVAPSSVSRALARVRREVSPQTQERRPAVAPDGALESRRITRTSGSRHG
jgi:transposase-like protein